MGNVNWTTILSYVGLAYVVLTASAAFFAALSTGFAKFWPGGAAFCATVAQICGTVAGALHTIPVSKVVKDATKAAPVALLVGLSLTQTGCPRFPQIIAEVISYETDASAVLNIIESAKNVFFLLAPNPQLQTQVEQALKVTWSAYDVAVRALDGVQDLTREQVDAAFDDFRKAYGSLLDLLKQVGIVSPTPQGGAYQTARGDIIPTPLALVPRKAVSR